MWEYRDIYTIFAIQLVSYASVLRRQDIHVGAVWAYATETRYKKGIFERNDNQLFSQSVIGYDSNTKAIGLEMHPYS